MAIIFPGVWALDIFDKQPFLNRSPPGFDFIQGTQFRPLGTLPPSMTVVTEDFAFKTASFLGLLGFGGNIHKSVLKIRERVQQEGSDVFAYGIWHRTEFNVEVPKEFRIPASIGGVPIPFIGGDAIPIPFGGKTLATIESWRLKILHSIVGIAFFIGVSILMLTSLVVLWGLTHMESVPEQISMITEDLGVLFKDTISAPFAGATQVLLLFVVGGAIFSFAVFFAGRATGAKELKPPTAPAIPGLAAPTVTVGPPGARVQTGIRGAPVARRSRGG